MHPAQLLSDPRRPYKPQGPSADRAPTSGPNPHPNPHHHLPCPASDPTALPAPFNPPEQVTRKLLRQLVDPTLSLTTIADTHNTDLDSLCAWMAREDIRQRFNNFRSACAERTRAAAENCLSMVVQTAHAVIHEFHDDQHHMNFKPQDPQGHEVKRRNRETAMRAGRLLLRLARYYSLDTERASRLSERTPTQPRQRPNPNPSPELLAILDNPTVAAQLAQAIAAQQSKAPISDAGAAAPATPPNQDASTPRCEPSTQNSEARESGRNTHSPGRQPREHAAPIPKPAEQAKQARPNTPRETPVPLTISARPLLAPAGTATPRAP